MKPGLLNTASSTTPVPYIPSYWHTGQVSLLPEGVFWHAALVENSQVTVYVCLALQEALQSLQRNFNHTLLRLFIQCIAPITREHEPHLIWRVTVEPRAAVSQPYVLWDGQAVPVFSLDTCPRNGHTSHNERFAVAEVVEATADDVQVRVPGSLQDVCDQWDYIGQSICGGLVIWLWLVQVRIQWVASVNYRICVVLQHSLAVLYQRGGVLSQGKCSHVATLIVRNQLWGREMLCLLY